MTIRTHAVRFAAVMALGMISCGRGGHLLGPHIIEVKPAAVALAPGKSQRFIAIGTNANPAWSVGDAGNGIISANGLYEAPFLLPADRTVTLHADPGGHTSEITLLAVSPDPLDCCGSTQDYLPSLADTVVVDEAPKVLIQVAPEYPLMAIEAGVDGTVQMDVLVCRNGLTYDTRVTPGKSIPMLNEHAEYAVRKWRFKPARVGGQPVAAWTKAHVRFVLP